MTFLRILSFLALVALAACNSSEQPAMPQLPPPVPAPTAMPMPMPMPTPGATVDRFCHQPAQGRCQAARLAQGYEAERAQLDCQQAGGTSDTTPCDTTNLVGRCVAATRTSTTYFSPPNWTEESARATCAPPATWMPGSL